MQTEGKVAELILVDGLPAARILCPPRLVPAPGQYLLAHADGSDSPLADSVFIAKSFAGGFIAAPPAAASWIPGTRLHLRGPLGHGFTLPASARRIALVSFDAQRTSAGDSPRRLLALLDTAFKQDASVTLVCENPPDDLPLQVEVQPMRTLADVCNWADYIACDTARESLSELRERLRNGSRSQVRAVAQVLVRTPMPCGGLAECGVCAIEAHAALSLSKRGGYQLVCKDGPVFDLDQLMG